MTIGPHRAVETLRADGDGTIELIGGDFQDTLSAFGLLAILDAATDDASLGWTARRTPVFRWSWRDAAPASTADGLTDLIVAVAARIHGIGDQMTTLCNRITRDKKAANAAAKRTRTAVDRDATKPAEEAVLAWWRTTNDDLMMKSDPASVVVARLLAATHGEWTETGFKHPLAETAIYIPRGSGGQAVRGVMRSMAWAMLAANAQALRLALSGAPASAYMIKTMETETDDEDEHDEDDEVTVSPSDPADESSATGMVWPPYDGKFFSLRMSVGDRRIQSKRWENPKHEAKRIDPVRAFLGLIGMSLYSTIPATDGDRTVAVAWSGHGAQRVIRWPLWISPDGERTMSLDVLGGLLCDGAFRAAACDPRRLRGCSEVHQAATVVVGKTTYFVGSELVATG